MLFSARSSLAAFAGLLSLAAAGAPFGDNRGPGFTGDINRRPWVLYPAGPGGVRYTLQSMGNLANPGPAFVETPITNYGAPWGGAGASLDRILGMCPNTTSWSLHAPGTDDIVVDPQNPMAIRGARRFDSERIPGGGWRRIAFQAPDGGNMQVSFARQRSNSSYYGQVYFPADKAIMELFETHHDYVLNEYFKEAMKLSLQNKTSVQVVLKQAGPPPIPDPHHNMMQYVQSPQCAIDHGLNAAEAGELVMDMINLNDHTAPVVAPTAGFLRTNVSVCAASDDGQRLMSIWRVYMSMNLLLAIATDPAAAVQINLAYAPVGGYATPAAAMMARARGALTQFRDELQRLAANPHHEWDINRYERLTTLEGLLQGLGFAAPVAHGFNFQTMVAGLPNGAQLLADRPGLRRMFRA